MIYIIAAISRNNVIGKNNVLPWKISADLKHFSKITTGHTVVMGSNTYKSIIQMLGKTLSNRRNIVLTSKKAEEFPGVEIVSSVDKIVEIGKKEDIFIIGGAKVYEQTLPNADKLYITKVEADIDGDAFFPKIDPFIWKITNSENHEKDDKNEYNYKFEIYEKN